MLKKLLIAVLMLLVTIGTNPSFTQAASCPFSQLEGTAEISGVPSYVYKVGEAYRAREVGIIIYIRNKTRYYSDNTVKYFANNVPIYNGYKFKEPGNKTIVLKRGKYQAQYKLKVVPVINGPVKNIYVLKDLPTKNYLKYETIPLDKIIVRCEYQDGRVQNFDHDAVEFYLNGDRIARNGRYKIFKEPGNYSFLIKIGEHEIRDQINIAPAATR